MRTSGIAGRIRCSSWVAGEAPAPADADTGSHLSETAKMMITTIPDTNSGTVAADSPSTEMIRSVARPYLSAASTPPRIPSGTTITKASAASLTEFTSAAWTYGSTADRYWYDWPMLPCSRPVIQVQYWVSSGRSTPS